MFFVVSGASAAILRAVKPLKGRYIVTLQNVPGAQVDVVAAALARQHRGRLLGTMTHAIQAFGVAMPEAEALALSKSPLVKLVEEDELVELSSATEVAPFDFASTKRLTPRPSNDPNCPWNAGGYFLCTYADDTFWNLDRLDNQGQIYGTKRYGYLSTGSGVRAYIVDTGVYAAHSELLGRVETGANMTIDPDVTDPIGTPGEEPPIQADYTPPNNPCGGWLADPNAGAGHGTGVASVLGGTTVGVAKDVTIIPVKVFNCAGAASKLAMARGLDWIEADMAGRQNRAVVNMSFRIPIDGTQNTQVCEDGNGGYTNCLSAFENEISDLINANVVVFAAANNQNDGNCASSPARMGYGNEVNFPSTNRTITVGGTMYTGAYVDQRWTCAAQPGGCTIEEAQNNPGSNYGPCVSIWAPAWNINVAGASGPNSYRTAYRNRSGTSFSSPYAAGVAARLLQRYPTLTPRQVWDELVSRANLRWGPPDFDPSNVVNTRLVYMTATD